MFYKSVNEFLTLLNIANAQNIDVLDVDDVIVLRGNESDLSLQKNALWGSLKLNDICSRDEGVVCLLFVVR